MNKTFCQANLTTFSILLLIWTVLVLGCTGKNVKATDEDAPKVERGRLKFAKSVKYLTVGQEPVSRDVQQFFFVGGKEWKPENDPDLANRINWCDTSPNPQVEILRCFGDSTEDYKTTYILRMKDDKPDIIKVGEGLPSIWIDDDGRWLLFGKSFVNVDTGEKIAFKVTPVARQNDDSVYVNGVIGVSPDMKMVATVGEPYPQKEGEEKFYKVLTYDIETGKTENQKVSFAKNPWLKDHQNPDNDIAPPPSQAKKIVWEKDKQGRYQPVFQK
jgi:hypothetical protein